MPDFGEILLAQAIQRRAEHLGGSADEIMHLRLKRFAASIEPGIGRDISVLLEDRCRIPVRRFALQPVAPLEQQNAFARRRELFGERAAAGAAADDDDVKVLVHVAR